MLYNIAEKVMELVYASAFFACLFFVSLWLMGVII